MMTDTVINTNALPEFLLGKIPTEKVLVKEIDGMIQIIPVENDAVITQMQTKRPISELFGMFEGMVWMSDDFDAPLEEMKEYME